MTNVWKAAGNLLGGDIDALVYIHQVVDGRIHDAGGEEYVAVGRRHCHHVNLAR